MEDVKKVSLDLVALVIQEDE